LVNSTQASFFTEDDNAQKLFSKTLQLSKRDKDMISVKLGERVTYEFSKEDGTPIPVLDFTFSATPAIGEKINGKDSVSKEVMLTLLADHSIVLSSV